MTEKSTFWGAGEHRLTSGKGVREHICSESHCGKQASTVGGSVHPAQWGSWGSEHEDKMEIDDSGLTSHHPFCDCRKKKEGSRVTGFNSWEWIKLSLPVKIERSYVIVILDRLYWEFQKITGTLKAWYQLWNVRNSCNISKWWRKNDSYSINLLNVCKFHRVEKRSS